MTGSFDSHRHECASGLARAPRRAVLLPALAVAVALAGCATAQTSYTTARAAASVSSGIAVRLLYRAHPLSDSRVDRESLASAIATVRTRLVALEVQVASVRRVGGDELSVTIPKGHGSARAEELAGATAQLHFYDWEKNVIGPSGRPEAEEASVTGGIEAGSAAWGLPEYEAVLRAAKRKPILRSNDTTWTRGCTLAENEAKPPAPNAECVYGQWYLLDASDKRVLRAAQETRRDIFSDGYRAPQGARLQIVHVNPGTLVIRAKPEESRGKVREVEPGSFYVINDDPALSGAEITHPTALSRAEVTHPTNLSGMEITHQAQSFESGGAGASIVAFGFGRSGASSFERLTKGIARRGEEDFGIGVTRQAAEQHLAVVCDEQLIAVPAIDFMVYPEGVDASNGFEIAAGTLTSAQNLADELRSGALPVALELISRLQVASPVEGQSGR